MLTISPAVPVDLPALLDLTRLCIARMREQGIDQWDDLYPDETILARDVAAGTVHLLRDADTVIGCVAVDTTLDPLWSDMDWSRPDAGASAVHRLMVHPDRQGQGLARRLMSRAEAIARERGSHSVRLDAFLANPAALHLYESLGYRRTGTARMRKGEFAGFEKLM